MKILVVAATVGEITPFLNHFGLNQKPFVETETFDVLITGVGMVATAFALGQKLNAKYDLVLNVGIAGSFDSGIQLGELVCINEDIIAELGAEDHDNFIKFPELGFGDNAFFASSNINLKLKKVRGITVNKAHGNTQSIEKISHLYQPQVESMEGAAVFYAAAQGKIPALQVRSISNYVEPRNRENWKINIAIKQLNDWLINFISQ